MVKRKENIRIHLYLFIKSPLLSMFNENVKVKYLISSPILLVSTRSSSEPHTQINHQHGNYRNQIIEVNLNW